MACKNGSCGNATVNAADCLPTVTVRVRGLTAQRLRLWLAVRLLQAAQWALGPRASVVVATQPMGLQPPPTGFPMAAGWHRHIEFHREMDAGGCYRWSLQYRHHRLGYVLDPVRGWQPWPVQAPTFPSMSAALTALNCAVDPSTL
jgi:hypothetical protein